MSAPATQAQALALRLFGASLAAAELMTMYLGLRLGLYDALAEGSATPGDLAQRAGIGARYATEWLEQQAAAGIVAVDDVLAGAHLRRYQLPEGHLQALTDTGPFAVLPVGGIAPVLPQLMAAMRQGAGLPYEEYGEAMRTAQSGMNWSVFERSLAPWIRTALPDVHQALRQPGAAIADVGCGTGTSSLVLARTYPTARVDGFDLDEEAVEAARARVPATARERLRFTSGTLMGGSYDLVCILDALHDMSQPVEVLRACRVVLKKGGCVLLMEPKVGAQFTAPADDVERFMYAVSVLHCLPVGLADQSSAGTGTVMRADTVRRYASAAGFTTVIVLSVEHRFHRLYRLD